MFDFQTESQKEITAAVLKLCQGKIPAFEKEQYYGSVPRALFEAFAELGVTGLTIPEQFGGLGCDTTTTMLVTEMVARHNLGPAIFLCVHGMVCGLINRHGTDKQRQHHLPALAAGKSLGAFALTEPSAGSDASALKTTATAVKGGFKLNGEKCYITSAGYADIYLVFARTGPAGAKGISCFIVDKNSIGLTISPAEKKMGCELSPIASLTFSDCFVPEEALLGDLNGGYVVALSGLAGGRVSIAACANGLSTSAIDRSIEHLKNRSQFGSKLIEFQGLQFMLADMHMQLEAAKALCWQAAQMIDRGAQARDIRLSTSSAKCFATDAAMKITTDAVQLLGGAGYIKEYVVERLMRDAKMLQIVEGTNQIQRMVIARELGK